MKTYISILLICLSAGFVYALEPSQILIIANSDINESVKLAKYYCVKRGVPSENILKIPLGQSLAEEISRQQYDNTLAAAVKNEFQKKRLPGEITCLLTLYGVPIKVGPAGPVKNSSILVSKLASMLDLKLQDFNDLLNKMNNLGRKEFVRQNDNQAQTYDNTLGQMPQIIKEMIKRIEYIESQDLRKEQYDELELLMNKLYGPIYVKEYYPQIAAKPSTLEETELNRNVLILQLSQQDRWSIDKKIEMNYYKAAESAKGIIGVISDIKDDIGRCKGSETQASVDSELSMVLFENYDLYRWQRNELMDASPYLPQKTLMVSRLDGPSAQIAADLVDKAIKAEKNGLSGKAYIDTRGFDITGNIQPYSFEFFDKSLCLLADMLKSRTKMEVIVEKTPALFAPAACPKTAIYCGWYSLRKYVDSFEFVPGAVGYHIASLEAMDLRNPASSNWCPAMLTHGITATLGPVNEPYLMGFPQPDKFFAELLNGKCLVEAFYRTNPFNSWQLVLIGDPLYKLNIK